MSDLKYPFVHLRAHTEYSLVDGLLKIKPWLNQIATFDIPAVAMTDEMNLFAAIKFYKTAVSNNIKPIFGVDCWIVDSNSNSDLNSNQRFKICLLCLNNQGYHQLTELISESYLESERINGLPVIKYTQLDRYKKSNNLNGLICLNGGMDSELFYVAKNKKNNLSNLSDLSDLEDSKLLLKKYLNWFSKDNFYLEIQRTGREGESEYNELVVNLAQDLDISVVATHDVRFMTPEDFQAHEVRVAIRDGYTLMDKRRPQNYTPNQYLKSPEEMYDLFSDCPIALQNTVSIAKRCNVNFELGKPCLPEFPIPDGETEGEYFRRVSHEGLIERLKEDEIAENKFDIYKERLDIELDVILNMGFPGYFLIVADFIQWSKHNDIPVGPGRGSGAGSLVAYVLRITDIDPLPYDLLFERFLNPERVSMPDFDVDFCMDGRDRVIQYVAEKYGRNAVSQIITYGSMAAKAVVRDVGRVMSQPYGFVDSIAKLIPMDLGMTLTKALEDEPKLKARYEEEEDVQAILDMALQLEGTVRNVGKHAGGVVIAPSKLTDFTPVYCETGSTQLVSQYDKDDVEAAGLVKFDFLGLRNLTIIHNAIKIISPQMNIAHIPLDDPKAFELLKACKTTAVFQLESRGMKDLIKRLQPDCFEEIIALVALFRPGPLQSGMVDDFIDRKHGRAEVVYPHPLSEEILKPTYGIILYQEQVMLLAQVLANYSLGAADLLRRAMGKKKPEEMAKQREIFLKGSQENNIDSETANGIFDLMEKFAGYGFNKSHSAAYALVAYQTAYLKAHYPAEFMAAVLSSDMDNTDKVVNFIEDVYLLKLNLLAPNINSSQYSFTVSNPNEILFGLGAIKGVGEAAIELIILERQKGEFKNLFDFCERLDLRKVNKRVIEALIYSGAMDKIGPSRESLIKAVPLALARADQLSKAQSAGQSDLFGNSINNTNHSEMENSECNMIDYPDAPEDKLNFLLQEKNVLGLFFSAHPSELYREELSHMRVKTLNRLRPTSRGDSVLISGVITQSRRIKTKKNQLMLILTLDDGLGKLDLTLFPDQAEQYGSIAKTPYPVIAKAEIQHDDFTGGLRGRCHELQTLSQARITACKKIKLELDCRDKDEQVCIEQIGQLSDYLNKHPGDKLIECWIINKTGKLKLQLPSGIQLTDCEHLNQIFGEAAVVLQYSL